MFSSMLPVTPLGTLDLSLPKKVDSNCLDQFVNPSALVSENTVLKVLDESDYLKVKRNSVAKIRRPRMRDENGNGSPYIHRKTTSLGALGQALHGKFWRKTFYFIILRWKSFKSSWPKNIGSAVGVNNDSLKELHHFILNFIWDQTNSNYFNWLSFFKTLKIVFLDEDPGTGQVGPGVSTKFINHLQWFIHIHVNVPLRVSIWRRH